MAIAVHITHLELEFLIDVIAKSDKGAIVFKVVEYHGFSSLHEYLLIQSQKKGIGSKISVV